MRRGMRLHGALFILKCPFHFVDMHVPVCNGSSAFSADSFANLMEPMLLFHIVDPSGSAFLRRNRVMSVVTALSLVLIVGFLATGMLASWDGVSGCAREQVSRRIEC